MAKETGKETNMETVEKKEKAEKCSKVEQKNMPESIYSLDALAANAEEIFKTRQECVLAALRGAGKTECTVSEAKKIIEKFLKKEVK